MLYQVLGGLSVLIAIGLAGIFFFKGMAKLGSSTLENAGAKSVDVGAPKSPVPTITPEIQECLETVGTHFGLSLEIAADDQFGPMAVVEGESNEVIMFETETIEESNAKLIEHLEKLKPKLTRFFRITEGYMVGADDSKPDDVLVINIWTKTGRCPEKAFWAFKRVAKGRLTLIGDPLIVMNGGRVEDPKYYAALMKGMRSVEYGAELLKGRDAKVKPDAS